MNKIQKKILQALSETKEILDHIGNSDYKKYANFEGREQVIFQALTKINIGMLDEDVFHNPKKSLDDSNDSIDNKNK